MLGRRKLNLIPYFLCLITYTLCLDASVFKVRKPKDNLPVTSVNGDPVPVNAGDPWDPKHAPTPHVVNGSFDHPIESFVNKDESRTYYFPYEFSADQSWAIKVCVKSDFATIEAPLLVVVRQSVSIMSLNVPLTFSGAKLKYGKVCHTLCPLTNFDPRVPSGHEELDIELASNSADKVNFSLLVSNVTDFVIKTEQSITVNITASIPSVLEYHMPDKVRSVLVHAVSKDAQCMILAIQDIKCPFYDAERTVEYKGFYQTLTYQSGITITRKSFKDGKVYIVMILKPTNKECSGSDENVKDSTVKEVVLTVMPSISDTDFYEAIFGAFGFFLLVYIFSFIISVFLFVRKRRHSSFECASQSSISTVACSNPSIQTYGTVTASSSYASHTSVNPSVPEPLARRGSDVSLDETDMDKLPDAEHDKEVVRTKTTLYVSDLARKKEKHLKEKTSVYSWNLITIAIFYGLPVVQLVYINQKIVNLTGNQDLCYYNFLCSHKLWVFSDFNHVFSNVGYVLLGILFLLLVWRREALDTRHERESQRTEHYKPTGIPHHFGLFYAMGWALIMEGVLSASYHVCPNKANFQFDTAFMYVIATVCMLKLYQARHPDITAKSHSTWMLLSVVIFIGVVGVLQGGTAFWVVFIFFHILATFVLSTTIYYMGIWKLDRWIMRRVFRSLKMDLIAGSFRPTYPGRFVMLGIAVMLNLALDIFGLIKRPANFASFLLGVFIMNLMLYLLYYTAMKIRYKERIRWIPLMYIVLSFASWGAALHFFLLKNTSWQMTPAGSRERNKLCVILNFYDDHDIWHFVSSFSLFFSYMVLFTLDDDLENTPRDQINVF